MSTPASHKVAYRHRARYGERRMAGIKAKARSEIRRNVPSPATLKQLPRRAVAAVVSRCTLRVRPLLLGLPEYELLAHAIRAVEGYATGVALPDSGFAGTADALMKASTDRSWKGMKLSLAWWRFSPDAVRSQHGASYAAGVGAAALSFVRSALGIDALGGIASGRPCDPSRKLRILGDGALGDAVNAIRFSALAAAFAVSDAETALIGAAALAAVTHDIDACLSLRLPDFSELGPALSPVDLGELWPGVAPEWHAAH
jgi:hypothetical protein